MENMMKRLQGFAQDLENQIMHKTELLLDELKNNDELLCQIMPR